MAVCYASDGAGQNFPPIEFNFPLMKRVESIETPLFSRVLCTGRQLSPPCK
jgi:hypothetical protein